MSKAKKCDVSFRCFSINEIKIIFVLCPSKISIRGGIQKGFLFGDQLRKNERTDLTVLYTLIKKSKKA
ncbi:hypothetical protein [Alkalihalobacterium alkalinitrilicum]|uniref:hypothetical protein n=1 Tax=Alkalihalobacterium alkalinitrilicum TaxID=427920 RepID=UPI000995928E|nr:hypothetical protein [Alkalihalobacterium alkalinitrilicum]